MRTISLFMQFEDKMLKKQLKKLTRIITNTILFRRFALQTIFT